MATIYKYPMFEADIERCLKTMLDVGELVTRGEADRNLVIYVA